MRVNLCLAFYEGSGDWHSGSHAWESFWTAGPPSQTPFFIWACLKSVVWVCFWVLCLTPLFLSPHHSISSTMRGHSLPLKNVMAGAREMAWWGKVISVEVWGPSSKPQHPLKKPDVAVQVCNSSAVCNRAIRVAGTWSLGWFSERPSLQGMRQTVTVQDIPYT